MTARHISCCWYHCDKNAQSSLRVFLWLNSFQPSTSDSNVDTLCFWSFCKARRMDWTALPLLSSHIHFSLEASRSTKHLAYSRTRRSLSLSHILWLRRKLRLALAIFLKWWWAQYGLVGIKDPPVPKTDTGETENLDKIISFVQKGASMYLLQLSWHASTKWPTMAPPYIPDAVVPAPNPGFVQVRGSQSPSIG
jgi:hypothetical protein